MMHRVRADHLQLIWPESKKRYHARNPFLLAWEWSRIRLLARPQRLSGAIFASSARSARTAKFTIIQGVDMGRPSEIAVSVIGGEPGVRVAGAAHRIDD